MNDSNPDYDVVIIGAGPAGSVAAALLCQRGYAVHIVEKQHFPRFSIGESLLPQCMSFVEEAGMLQALNDSADEMGFQFKNGAAFARGDEYTDFDFAQKSSEGPSTTFQVQRAAFDQLLAREAERQGASFAWGHAIVQADFDGPQPVLTVADEDGQTYSLQSKFVLDASGFGRILPRLLKLDRPSDFPSRASLFTHIEDGIEPGAFDRNKIRVTIHPQHKDVWYWLIPFGNGRCSLGVVAREEFFTGYPEDPIQRLQQIVDEDPGLSRLLSNANYDTPARQIVGYASNVSQLSGKGFALLGNAGEFLDPVFSSGVTIAMKSASMAVALLDCQLQGETVDWETDYARPLKEGVDCFRVFVEAWYDGRFQDVIFASNQSRQVREMICAILAGYAWDKSNPFVKEGARRLDTLAQLCRAQG